MSYTIDVFRRRVAPARSFIDYAAFVAMFPHLIAGPIVRYADIEDQLRRLEPRLSPGLAASGMWFFACGLVKKLIIADTLNAHVERPVRRLGRLCTSCTRGWRALGYSLQLYFDFSGYSDMAVGLAYLLGLPLPAELRLAVQGPEHLRLLAALAHVAVVLAARLPVHPARRIAPRAD